LIATGYVTRANFFRVYGHRAAYNEVVPNLVESVNERSGASLRLSHQPPKHLWEKLELLFAQSRRVSIPTSPSGDCMHLSREISASRSIVELFCRRVSESGDAVALQTPRDGEYVSFTWNDIADDVRRERESSIQSDEWEIQRL